MNDLHEMNGLMWFLYYASFLWLPAVACWSWWRTLLSVILGTYFALDLNGPIWMHILIFNFFIFTLTTWQGWAAIGGVFAANKLGD